MVDVDWHAYYLFSIFPDLSLLFFFNEFLSGVRGDYRFGWPKGYNSYNRLGGAVLWYFSPRKAY